MPSDIISPKEPSSVLDELKRALRYDPHTGNLYWRIRTHGSGRSKHPGDLAGTLRKDGRAQIRHAGKVYLAHRLAWLLMTGVWPPRSLQIEHRDANPSNNRWANLFLVTCIKNKQNPNDRLQKNNRSGCRGASMHPNGSWRAGITIDGRGTHLGYYPDLEQAVAARKAAERHYFGSWHSEALDLKLRAVIGDSYILRQIRVVRP
jgi:hypothetical protein